MSQSAGVAQLVEHFIRNEGVPGSSPGVGFAPEPCAAARAATGEATYAIGVPTALETFQAPSSFAIGIARTVSPTPV